MKLLYTIIFLTFLGMTNCWSAEVSADEAMRRLREGNERFISGNALHPNIEADRLKSTALEGQKPFATILACSDSRVPVEILFDQGVGDLFVIKVAGNVADTDEIATIEYGTEHLHTPILLVLGHSRCGAVTAVVTGAEVHGHLPKLVDNVAPALEKAKHEHPEKHGKDLVDPTIKANTFQSMADVLSKSAIVAKLVKEGHLKVVGAIYNLETGAIEWLGAHPEESKLIANVKEVHGEHAEEAHEKSFFSTSNFIYMAIFVFVTSLIAGLIVFFMTRKK